VNSFFSSIFSKKGKNNEESSKEQNAGELKKEKTEEDYNNNEESRKEQDAGELKREKTEEDYLHEFNDYIGAPNIKPESDGEKEMSEFIKNRVRGIDNFNSYSPNFFNYKFGVPYERAKQILNNFILAEKEREKKYRVALEERKKLRQEELEKISLPIVHLIDGFIEKHEIHYAPSPDVRAGFNKEPISIKLTEEDVSNFIDLAKSKNIEITKDDFDMLITWRVNIINNAEATKLFNGLTDYNKILEKYIENYGERVFEKMRITGLNNYIAKNKITMPNGEETQKDIKPILLKHLQQKYKELTLKTYENRLLMKQKITITQLDMMTGAEFQDALAKIFQNQGYKITRTPLSNDYGADLILEKFGKKIVVQAKRYEKTVPNRAIQEAHTAKDYFTCDEAWIITQSKLSKNSISMANKLNVKIIDREKLIKLL